MVRVLRAYGYLYAVSRFLAYQGQALIGSALSAPQVSFHHLRSRDPLCIPRDQLRKNAGSVATPGTIECHRDAQQLRTGSSLAWRTANL